MIERIFIREDKYRADMEKVVLPFLAARMTEHDFPGYDGKPLHALCYTADHPKATVIISHGFTESARKYTEFSYYLVRCGYTVYIPEHRGHGQSYRPVSDPTLTHIDHFSEYVSDFACFVDTVVKTADTTLPLCLFAHSMGGGIGALYMEEHPDVFAKAVLSSPMIAPDGGGIPLWIGRAITFFFKLCGKSRHRAFISGVYPGEEAFEDSCATSRERFCFYERQKRATPYLRNYSSTYGWVHASLSVRGNILRRGAPERITIPVAVFSAANDTVVQRAPQEALARRLPCGTFSVIPDAKHEILFSKDETLLPYLTKVLDFIG